LETPNAVLERSHELDLGGLPVPAAAVCVNTVFDPSQAPTGFHAAGAAIPLPSVDRLSPAMWQSVSGSFNSALIARWHEVAPNMTAANVLAERFETPSEFERRILLLEGEAQYRSEIESLYLCGPGSYPGGGVHGACGYNAYRVIAGDLHLRADGVSTRSTVSGLPTEA
jgi:phytoene dehydrogenase-like protein